MIVFQIGWLEILLIILILTTLVEGQYFLWRAYRKKHRKKWRQRMEEYAQEQRDKHWPYEELMKTYLDDLTIQYQHQYYVYTEHGSFIGDFYLPDYKIIIEVDGGYHFTDKGIEKDAKRDLLLNEKGYKVLHFKNEELDEPLFEEKLKGMIVPN